MNFEDTDNEDKLAAYLDEYVTDDENEEISLRNIRLKRRQKPHYVRCDGILDNIPFYIDGSGTGTGKSINLLKLAKKRNLSLIVISPLGVIPKWKKDADKYNVPFAYSNSGEKLCITYDALRGVRTNMEKRILKHELLYRTETEDNPEFEPSNLLFDLVVNKGVMVVFDETQMVKNATADQSRAAKRLIQFVTNCYKIHGSRSRLAFLSATLNDKPEQIINYLKMVGFIEHDKLYSKKGGYITCKGIKDLLDVGDNINPIGAEEFRLKVNPIKLTYNPEEYIHEYFINVIKPVCMSIMKKSKINLVES